MSLTEKAYWVAFGQISRITPLRFKKIINYFPSLETAWYAGRDDLAAAGIEAEVIDDFFIKRETVDPASLWQAVLSEGIGIITLTEPSYPNLLKEIYDPPPFLYYRGRFDDPDEFRLAVVGTRKTTPYGRQVTPEIVRDLAAQKLTIVSGMALGIDSHAHEAAIEAGGRTIAVLGSGIDRSSIYPSTNRRLAERIIESGGAVISEFPLGAIGLKHHFPQRNRIISGLSLGTLVIEAGEVSGSLITAKHALEQNREVFAVPGSIHSPTAVGPNNLIKMGARAVTGANDVLESLDLTEVRHFAENKTIIPESDEEGKILRLLSKEPIHIDKIIKESKLDPQVVIGTLALMEMKGKTKNLGAMNYIIGH